MSKWLTPKNSTIAFGVFTMISLLHPALKGFLLVEMSLVAMFTIILLHECGHLLFGKWADYEFIFLIIGPFSIEKTEHGISINENNNWLLFGGVISMIPKMADMQQIRKQHMLFTAGGPITSLVLALFAFSISFFTESELWFYFSLGNVIIFLVTVMPLKLGMDTDGRVILQLLQGGQQAEKLLQAITFSNELLSKKSPLEWNQAYLQIAKSTT
ncbi:M50 family metallopeptidase [Metasolibacillus meyeri]|uniref:M50 family metallopeptidase n=1 Tax=Metasolibacillus meyeri TaxID=1071052 RepID=A0AAW9NSU1_9BACL|nr:M50 family metallopeptidase [Metasolibacillus meyeri]MEC1178799.1 M50 family metallopeptidase [Metasolibacillus meyeri]